MKNWSKVILYTDGASRGNPGKAGIAYILCTPDGKIIKKESKFIGTATNNVAEYIALIYGMQEALGMGVKEITCCSDSELLIHQLNGRYRVKSSVLSLFYNQIKHLQSLFNKVRFCYIPRTNNIEADRLAKQAVRG